MNWRHALLFRGAHRTVFNPWDIIDGNVREGRPAAPSPERPPRAAPRTPPWLARGLARRSRTRGAEPRPGRPVRAASPVCIPEDDEARLFIGSLV